MSTAKATMKQEQFLISNKGIPVDLPYPAYATYCVELHSQ